MGTYSLCRGAVVGFLVVLLSVAGSFCHAGDESVLEVVGTGVCADCAESKIKTGQAFSGLRVSIDCKPANGANFERRGVGVLDEAGNFKVSLSSDIFQNGKLKEDCYAQLHSASAAPCPAHSGLESSKIVVKSTSDGRQTLTTAGKLTFSPATCTSSFLWAHFNYPPLPTWKKPLPKFNLPPSKNFGHPFPSPFHRKPFPPVPVYQDPPPGRCPVCQQPPQPPAPVYPEPLPPPVPSYNPKPKPPFNKPPVVLPPPVPIYNPMPPVVLPPPVPIYNPMPPVVLPPPVPVSQNPFPPSVPINKEPPPPFPNRPCPPPGLPKLPLVPNSPPKVFPHPQIGHLPPYPPLLLIPRLNSPSLVVG